MTSDLDTEFAVAFLHGFDPTGWHNLVAIDPGSGAIQGRTFPPGSSRAIAEWIGARNGHANLYFSVNEPRPKAPHNKLKKTDIAAIRAIYTDIDPSTPDPKEKQTIVGTALESDADIAVDSGGGVQLFWTLDKKQRADDFEWAEGCNRRLASNFGGDHTWDVNRIMRLPYTRNLPNAKKLAQGRAPTDATILRATGVRWTRDALLAAFPPKGRGATDTADNNDETRAVTDDIRASDYASYADYEDLPADLRRKFNALLARDADTRELWLGEGAGNENRFALAAVLKMEGFAVSEYAALARVWHRATTKPHPPEARELARDWVRSPVIVTAAAEFGTIDIDIGEPPAQPDFLELGKKGNEPAREPRLIRASMFASMDRPEREFLVHGLIPHKNVTLLSGDGGTGKSLLALQLATSMLSGRKWIGQPIERSGPVLYFSAEDDEDETHIRLKEICSADGLDLASMGDLHIALMAGEDALLVTEHTPGAALKKTPLFGRLQQWLQRIRPALLILDNLVDIFGGNQNAPTLARQFIGALRGLSIEYDCAVLLLAHPSLSGMTSGSGTAGTVAWSNSARSRMYLQRHKDNEGTEADPNMRYLEVKKANYGPTGSQIDMRWDNGRFVALEDIDMGDLDDPSCGTETKVERAERIFKELLARFTTERRHVSPAPGANYAPAVFARHPQAGGVGKAYFEIAMNNLLGRNVVVNTKVGSPSRQVQSIVFAREENEGVRTPSDALQTLAQKEGV